MRRPFLLIALVLVGYRVAQLHRFHDTWALIALAIAALYLVRALVGRRRFG